MNSKAWTILIQIVCWAIFLSLPLIIFPIGGELGIHNNFSFYLPLILNSLFLVVIFYANYYYFIPKLFFGHSYWLYALVCVVCLVLILCIPILVFSLLGGPPAPPVKLMPQSAPRQIIPAGFITLLLMYMVAFFASIGLSINNRLKQAEQEKLSTHLSYLKTQINPHFLFNTLNSIYAVAIGSSPQSAEMVEKLARIMQYTLKDTQRDLVELEKELLFIRNYIDLQKVRLDSNIVLIFKITGANEELMIAPLLLIPFIENAFKHGVNSEEDSHIEIVINIDKFNLDLFVRNNKVAVVKLDDNVSGIGIQNTKHRLEMLYQSKYKLEVIENEFIFEVKLRINLK